MKKTIKEIYFEFISRAIIKIIAPEGNWRLRYENNYIPKFEIPEDCCFIYKFKSGNLLYSTKQQQKAVKNFCEAVKKLDYLHENGKLIRLKEKEVKNKNQCEEDKYSNFESFVNDKTSDLIKHRDYYHEKYLSKNTMDFKFLFENKNFVEDLKREFHTKHRNFIRRFSDEKNNLEKYYKNKMS